MCLVGQVVKRGVVNVWVGIRFVCRLKRRQWMGIDAWMRMIACSLMRSVGLEMSRMDVDDDDDDSEAEQKKPFRNRC